MRLIKYILALVFACLLFTPTKAKSKEIRFQKFTTSDGLHSNVVYSMLQDSKGLIWLGTKEGLNRFDGYQIVNFPLPQGPFAKVADRRINVLIEDKDQNIWMATQIGVVFLNRESGKMKYYLMPYKVNKSQSLYVNDLAVSASNEIWVGTRNGLFKFNREQDQFEQYEHFPFNSETVSYSKGERLINDLCFDKNGHLWIGTAGNGITVLDTKKKKKQQFRRSKKRKEGELISNYVEDLFKDREGKMWIATVGGLNLFQEKEESFVTYRHSEGDKYSLSDSYITAINDDEKGNLWIGTQKGLNFFDREEERFYNYQHHPLLKKSISSNNILAVMSERSGSFWVGTMQGVNHFSPNSLPFELYQNIPQNKYSLPDNTLRAVVSDELGNVWVGMMRDGISHFDPVKKEFKPAKVSEATKRKKRHKTVRTAYLDSKGQVFFGTDAGVLKYNVKSRVFENFTAKGKLIFQKSVFEILEDDEGNYWFSELDKGIWKWNPQKGSIELLDKEKNDLTNQNVKVISQVTNGDIWVSCHMGGLCRLKRGESRFQSYRASNQKGSLSSNRVYDIFEDSKGNLWIATSNGLNLYNEKEDTFTSFVEKDGLPGNVVLSILEDEKNRLWLGTNKGLSCFDVKKKQFANFYQEDGLQGNIFEYKVACIDTSGQMYFGGNNGLNSFYPSHFKMNSFTPEAQFVSYSNSGESGDVFQQKVELYHTDQNLSVTVASMSYWEPEKNRIRYRISSLDTTWTLLPLGEHQIVVPELAIGEHQLEVLVSNNHMKWSSSPAVMMIVVNRNWKQYSWLLYLLVLVSVLSAGAVVYANRRKKEERKKVKAKVVTKKAAPAPKKKEWEESIKTLNQFMEEEKPYLDKRLTKSQLAIQLSWSEVQLSNTLRDGLQISFNDFINTYRVDEVKNRLQDPQNKDYTLLAIAEDCGFNSKTSFYRIFKKFTDLTPSEYLEKQEN